MNSKRVKMCVVISGLLLLSAGASSMAQIRTLASLSGLVSDPSGAMIPGATVRVVNERTGVAASVTTNSSGYYYVPSLIAGTYKIEGSATGFKTFVQTGYIINVGDNAALDIHLSVGATKQAVTVRSQISTLQTTTAAIGDVVAGAQIQDLSVNGRNFITMMEFVPGVSIGAGSGPGNPSVGHLAIDFDVNGGRTEEIGNYIDGAQENDPGSRTSLATSPALAAIGEFKVDSSNYGAEYGGAGSAVVNVDIKSGTNQFHGEAYEFDRNNAFDAPQLFVDQIPTLKLNDFGFTVGGPIRKNKLFFFYSSEWRRQEAGTALSTHTPTAAELNGDFSQFPQVLPSSGSLLVPAGVAPGCVTGAQINSSCIDPQVKVLLPSGIFPAPTNPSVFQDYSAAPSTPTDFNQELVRIDYSLSRKLTLMGHYLQEGYDTVPVLPEFVGGNYYPTVSTNFSVPSKNIALEMTQIIKPTMFNEMRFGYSSDGDTGTPVGVYARPSNYNVPNLYPTNPDDRIQTLIFSQGYGSYDVGIWPWKEQNPLRTYGDTFTMIHGRQALRFGFEYQYDVVNVPALLRTQGEFTFTGGYTGNALADFELGLPATFSETSSQYTGFWRYQQFEPFVQDDITVGPHLTLNLGLRYYYIPHFYTTNNGITNFVPADWSASEAPQLTSAGDIIRNTGSLTNGLVRAGTTIPRGLVKNYDDDLGPRFGFAWDPFGHGNTVIRGGYGIYYYRVQENDSTSMTGNPPYVTTANLTAPPFDNPAGGAVAPLSPTTLYTLPQDYPVDMVQQWSFGVQRLLPKDSKVTVSYVGSRGEHLQVLENTNQPPPYENYNFNPILNVTGTPEVNYVPYRGYSTINAYVPEANSIYNSLQANYEKQMTHNFRFQASYAWSRSMDDGSDYGYAPQNSYDLMADWAPSDFDRAQVLAVNYIYDLPFFHGGKGLRGVALGGWQLAGITSYESGAPLDIGITGPNLGLATRPNVNGPVGEPKTIGEWFDTSIYSKPAFGFFGESGRNTVRRPGFGEWDISLYKEFGFGERTHLQLRLETFNAFNHANLLGVSTDLGAGNFGQVTSSLAPRIIQLGARFIF